MLSDIIQNLVSTFAAVNGKGRFKRRHPARGGRGLHCQHPAISTSQWESSHQINVNKLAANDIMNTSGSKCSIPSFHIVWSTGVNIAASPKSRVVWKLRFSLRFPVQFLVSVKMTSQSKSVIFRSFGLYSGTSLLQIVVWLCLLSFYSIYK